jgi:acyl-CoA synthetase (AMP-forming)/AMP-acid ligase II
MQIIDPRTRKPLEDQHVGEIWISGSSVASGYWRKARETETVFRAKLATGDGPWLRSGDLGFVAEGELFLAGRCKDLIIIAGNNFYPDDIERTVEASHAAVANGGCAAFSIDSEGEEKLVILVEMDRDFRRSLIRVRNWDTDRSEIDTTIRAAITKRHEIRIHQLVWVRPGTIPRTTSGKIRRVACREAYAAGEVAAWTKSPFEKQGGAE